MPQLDQVTFFSQFFWLFLFYAAFYVVILKNFLPILSRILKFRKKKITHSQQGIFGVKAQRNQISNTLDGILERAGNGSQNLFQTNLQAIHIWFNNILLETNRTQWKEIHPYYLSFLGEKSLSRNVAVNFFLKKTSESSFLSLLTEKISKSLFI